MKEDHNAEELQAYRRRHQEAYLSRVQKQEQQNQLSKDTTNDTNHIQKQNLTGANAHNNTNHQLSKEAEDENDEDKHEVLDPDELLARQLLAEDSSIIDSVRAPDSSYAEQLISPPTPEEIDEPSGSFMSVVSSLTNSVLGSSPFTHESSHPPSLINVADTQRNDARIARRLRSNSRRSQRTNNQSPQPPHSQDESTVIPVLDDDNDNEQDHSPPRTPHNRTEEPTVIEDDSEEAMLQVAIAQSLVDM